MGEATDRLRKAVIERVLHGSGTTSGDTRRAAFDNADAPDDVRSLIDKVARNAWKVTDEDVAAVRQHRDDDEIFELVIAAALGQSTRQLDAALVALDEACAARDEDKSA